MEIQAHYSRLLGINSSWEISSVDLLMDQQKVDIVVEYTADQGVCPECGTMCPKHDDRKARSWHHLDTMQCSTYLHCQLPRIRCQIHGAKIVDAPWAGKKSRFTLMFEAFAIRVLTAARSVEERTEVACKALVSQALTLRRQSHVTALALDMWQVYANAVAEKIPQADIVHDRFHISQHLNEAVDKARRKENKQLAEAGDKRLTGSKFHWLANQENLQERYSESFEVLRNSELKVARAWAIKELFRDLWTYQTAGWAKRHFEKWYSWVIRSRLDPIKAKARMIKTHLPNILTYFKHGISIAVAKGLNSKIQTVKFNARGYRSFAGFRNSILFKCGGLEMTP
jgi:transposase